MSRRDEIGFVAIPVKNGPHRLTVSESVSAVMGLGDDGEPVTLFDPFAMDMTVLKVEGPMALVAEFGRMVHQAATREIEEGSSDETGEGQGLSDSQGEVRGSPRGEDSGPEPSAPPGEDEPVPL